MRLRHCILVLSLSIALAGMASASGQNETAPTEDDPVTITYYLWDDPTYMSIVEAFNASQDEIFVQAEIIPANDYTTKMTTLLAAGGNVDAYMLKEINNLFPQVANGFVEPLDDYAARFGYDFDAIASYVDQVSVDGVVHAIPFGGASYFTFFNRAIFEEEGIPTPDVYVENGDWTWERFAEVAERLSDPDRNRYGGLIYTWGYQLVIPSWQSGIDFISSDGVVDVDESVPYSFELRRNLEESGAIWPLIELKVTRTHYSRAFFSGEAAMLTIGEWFPGMMLSARNDDMLQGFTWDDWGVTRLPQYGDTYRTYGAATTNVIHARASQERKDAAFQFIAWMGGSEGAKVVAEAGFLPPVIDEDVREILGRNLPDESSLAYYTESVPIHATFANQYGSEVRSLIEESFEIYLTSDISAEEITADMVDELREIAEARN